MQLSDRSITAIQKAITGDCDLFPYRTGGKLVGFFNKYGSKNTYQQGGFPSRWVEANTAWVKSFAYFPYIQHAI